MTNTTSFSTSQPLPISRNERIAGRLFAVGIACLAVAALSIAVTFFTGHGHVPRFMFIGGFVCLMVALTSTSTYAAQRAKRAKQKA